MLVRRAESHSGTVGRVEAGLGPTGWAPELSDAQFCELGEGVSGPPPISSKKQC
jgi:hypothetical protein